MRAGAFTHVEFIYTPVKTQFDCAINALCTAGLYGGEGFERKRVDDLDTTGPADRLPTRWKVRGILRGRGESLA